MWVPLLVLASAVAMGVYLYPLLAMDYAGQREVEMLEAQLAGLQERNEGLRDDVERLKTPEGVEQAARESLGFVKPGENAYVVLTPEDGAEATAAVMPEAETVLAREPVPWWKRVLDGLFGVGS